MYKLLTSPDGVSTLTWWEEFESFRNPERYASSYATSRDTQAGQVKG